MSDVLYDEWDRAFEEGKKIGREQAIRDCIAAVEAISDGGDTDTRYILASTAARLRALLEGDK